MGRRSSERLLGRTGTLVQSIRYVIGSSNEYINRIHPIEYTNRIHPIEYTNRIHPIAMTLARVVRHMNRRDLLIGGSAALASGLAGATVLTPRSDSEVDGTSFPFAVDEPESVPDELADGTVVRGGSDVPVYSRLIDDTGVEYVGDGRVVADETGIPSTIAVPFEEYATTVGERLARTAVQEYLEEAFDARQFIAVTPESFDGYDRTVMRVFQRTIALLGEATTVTVIDDELLIEETPRTVAVLVALTGRGGRFGHASDLRYAATYPVFVEVAEDGGRTGSDRRRSVDGGLFGHIAG